jgi:dynein intermediate chain 2
MFERETHREKILEARNREIRLRQKTKMAESSHREPTSKPSTSLDAEIKNAEEEFFTIIKRVIRTCHSVFRPSQY